MTRIVNGRFERFTERLTAALSADPDVLGLIAVGSTADASYRDAYSDHDFWIVATPDAVARYRATYEWLPNGAEVLVSVEHGAASRSALYRDGRLIEYAVFTPDEMPTGKLERYRVLIDRSDVTNAASSVAASTLAGASRKPEPLQNLALLVWTGHQRLMRGERISAHRYLTGFAVDNLLELCRARGVLGNDPTADRLDARRRLERLAPTVAEEIERVLALPLDRTGVALLSLAEQRVRPIAPDLNWKAVAEVRGWLQRETPGNF